MSTIEATNTMNSPLQNQRPRNRWLAWSGRVLIGLLVTLLALAGIGTAYQTIATARDALTFPRPGQLVDVGGYKLHIHCLGTGSPTVVTENGLGGSSPDWSLVRRLRAPCDWADSDTSDAAVGCAERCSTLQLRVVSEQRKNRPLPMWWCLYDLMSSA